MPEQKDDELNRFPSVEHARVLLVEDEPECAVFTQRLLRKAFRNVTPTHVTTLAEALRLLRSETWHLVITDLSLPDARGHETVRRLHEACPATPIVVLTGNADERMAARAVRLGAQDYLHKDELKRRTLWRVCRYAVERHQHAAALQRLAHYDALTGLANRSLFDEHLSRALKRAPRLPGKLAVMVADLDGFKELNDQMGHEAGDGCLVHVASALRDAVREADVLARLGGDEFAILLEAVTGQEEAARIGDRVVSAVRSGGLSEPGHANISCSVGLAMLEGDEDGAVLLRRADTAMYHAKRAGGDRCHVFDRRLQRDESNRRATARELRAAVDTRNFRLHYQPQQCLRTGRVLGAEALIRWLHPRRGLLAAEQFVSLLEEQRLIAEVGAKMLVEAAATLRSWRAKGWDLTLSLNVSALELDDRAFVSRVGESLEAAGARPGALRLELTESTLMQPGNAVLDTARQLDALGVGITIDDFGRGPSSLASLRRLPVKAVKIDPRFVAGPGGVDTPAVEAIVCIGRCLGWNVMAEGVETEDQRARIAAIGCDSYQGFVSMDPVPLDAFEAWAANESIAVVA